MASCGGTTDGAHGVRAAESYDVFDMWAYKIGRFCTPYTRRNLALVSNSMASAMRESWDEWMEQACTDMDKQTHGHLVRLVALYFHNSKNAETPFCSSCGPGAVGAYMRRVIQCVQRDIGNVWGRRPSTCLLMCVLADMDDCRPMMDSRIDMLVSRFRHVLYTHAEGQCVPFFGRWMSTMRHPALFQICVYDMSPRTKSKAEVNDPKDIDIVVVRELIKCRRPHELAELAFKGVDTTQLRILPSDIYVIQEQAVWWYPGCVPEYTIAHLSGIDMLDYLHGPDLTSGIVQVPPKGWRLQDVFPYWLLPYEKKIQTSFHGNFDVLLEFSRRCLAKMSDEQAVLREFHYLMHILIYLQMPETNVMNTLYALARDVSHMPNSATSVSWMSDECFAALVMVERYEYMGRCHCVDADVVFANYPIFDSLTVDPRWSWYRQPTARLTNIRERLLMHLLGLANVHALSAYTEAAKAHRLAGYTQHMPRMIETYVADIPVTPVFIRLVFLCVEDQMVRVYLASKERCARLRNFMTDPRKRASVSGIFSNKLPDAMILRNARMMREYDIVTHAQVVQFIRELMMHENTGDDDNDTGSGERVDVGYALVYAYASLEDMRDCLQQARQKERDLIFEAPRLSKVDTRRFRIRAMIRRVHSAVLRLTHVVDYLEGVERAKHMESNPTRAAKRVGIGK